MSKKIILFLFVILFCSTKGVFALQDVKWWKYQSVDTMKYSRDLARQKLGDKSFDATIESIVKNISATGATHIALATPYDEEFLPYLWRWVNISRSHGLNIWYRGNFSGWEGWFEYKAISREEHKSLTEKFINEHKTLFKDGDIFDPCPECENGGPGDPRENGDVEGFRKFKIDEYELTTTLFNKMDKKVITNFSSSNGDVARLIYDKKTVQAMGGVIAIDHYVSSPKKLIDDIKKIHANTGASIVLGEFGAPIPDIHGKMSEQQQAQWISETMNLMVDVPSVVGLNYWTSVGSSTEIWDSKGNVKMGADSLSDFYRPKNITISIVDDFDNKVAKASLSYINKTYLSDQNGKVIIPVKIDDVEIKIEADGYATKSGSIKLVGNEQRVVLSKLNPSVWDRLWIWLFRSTHKNK